MENELRLMISWFEKKVDEAEKNYKEKHKENLDIQKMNMHVNRKLKREIRIMNAVNIIPSALIIPAVKMEKKSLNKNLHKANVEKNDEFYTQSSDIEKELGHYKEYFKDKIVFLNCDDPEESNFWRYFSLNFEYLGLKRLMSTHFGNGRPAYKLEIVRDINKDGKINNLDTIKTPLKQNGDFRSPECIEILKEADIVVTNPPFSLFREYVAQLMEYNKKFIILGNQNAISYKEIFELIKKNKIWLGADNNGTKWFKVPDDYDITTESRKKTENGKKFFSMGNIVWFTNFDIKKRHENIILYKKYNPEEYPKYDNYEAINVSKVSDIPVDYKGVMGVPVTFLDKYNPDQFEIVGQMVTTKIDEYNHGYPYINGKKIYARILIRNKKI